MTRSFMFRNRLLAFLLILILSVSIIAPALAYDDGTLYNGCNGEEVKAMQQALINLGFLEGKADGKFGDKTEEAVKAFQRKNGLTPDGLAGKKTRSMLDSAKKGSNSTPATGKAAKSPVYSEGTLYNGCSGDEVKTMQEALIALGYLEGNADGKFGNKTEKAVRTFQQKNGLDPDGLAGRKTRSVLELAHKRLSAPMEMTAEEAQVYDEREGIDWAPFENKAKQVLTNEGHSIDGLNYIAHSYAPKGNSALRYDYYQLTFYKSKETSTFNSTYTVGFDPKGKLVHMYADDHGGKKLTHEDDPTAEDVDKDLMNRAKEEIKSFLKRYGYSSLAKKVSKLEISQISVSNDNVDTYYTLSGPFMICLRVAPSVRVDYFLPRD